LIVDVGCVHDVRIQSTVERGKRRPAGYQPAAVSPGDWEGWVSSELT
jgi:hypothetical protein